MKLSERQEQMVAAFFRQVGGQVDGLSASDRAQTLSTVKAHLQRELRGFGGARPSDDDLAVVLKRCFPAATPPATPSKPEPEPEPELSLELERPEIRPAAPAAKAPTPTIAEEPPGGLASPNRKWLGVCIALSDRLGVDVLMIRSAFLVAGLALAPLALLAYAACYFERYLFGDYPAAPPIQWERVWGLLLGIVAGAVLLYGLTRGFFWATDAIFVRAFSKPLVLGEWAWIAPKQGAYLTYTLVFSVPPALLGALPMASGWGYTLKRIAQAGLAVYCVALSAGIASALVGIILKVVEELSATLT